MAKKTVTINIAGGGLTVSSNVVRAKPKTNDTLCFTCPDGEFAVLYKNNRTPYKSPGPKAVSGNMGQTTKALKVRKLTKAEKDFPEGDPINGGTFSYGAVVLDSATGLILTLDPDIIVDDPGSGGGGNKKKTKTKATWKKR